MKILFKKILSLLNKSQKMSMIFLFFLMLIGMLLELLSVGMMIPLITVVMDPSAIEKYLDSLNFFADKFAINFISINDILNIPQQTIVAYVVITILIVYALKNLFLIFLSLKQANFLKNIQQEWTINLFKGYLNLPYAFHLKNNSALLMRNLAEVPKLVHGVDSLIILTTEFLVLMGIGTILFLSEPFGPISAIMTLSVAGGLYYFFTRNMILSWGNKKLFEMGQIVLHKLQGFGAVKELKILGRQENFAKKLAKHNEASLIIERNQKVFSFLSRSWLEMIFILSFSIMLLIMIKSNQDLKSTVPILGLFAAAAFRLIPSFSRILHSFQTLRFNLPSALTVNKELTQTIKKDFKKNQNGLMSFTQSIKLDNVGHKYEGRNKMILSNVSFEIRFGSFIGFVGESGVGKSTLVDIIIGLLKPSNGAVKIDGIDIQENLDQWLKKIGYVPQNIYLTDDTLANNIAFGLNQNEIDENRLKDVINITNLNKFVDTLPEKLDTKVGEKGVNLSAGQRQRIGIARALYHQPEIIVFDEATSNLDLENESEIMNLVSSFKGKKTLLVISHRLSALKNCDKIYQVDEGKVVSAKKNKNLH